MKISIRSYEKPIPSLISTGNEGGEEEDTHKVEICVGQSSPVTVSFCGNLLRSSGLWDSKTDGPQYGAIAKLKVLPPQHPPCT